MLLFQSIALQSTANFSFINYIVFMILNRIFFYKALKIIYLSKNHVKTR